MRFICPLTRSSALRSLALSAVVLAAFGWTHAAWATTGTWLGTVDSTWAGANWNASPAPVTSDTATFNAAAGTVNNRTTIDLGAGATVNSLVFDTTSAAAYTIGSGAAGSQALTAENAVTMNAAVAANQTINANVILSSATAGTYAITNSSVTSSLTFLGTLSGGTGGTAGQKVVNVNGAGAVSIGGPIVPGGASSIALRETSTGTLTLNGSGASTLYDLRATANGYVAVNGQTVTVSNQSNYGGSTAWGKFTLLSGSVAFNGGIQSATASGALAGSDGMAFIVDGGTFSASYVSLGRSQITGATAYSTAVNMATSGFQVNGGSATVTGNLGIYGSNSSATGQLSSGTLTVNGELIVGQRGGSRINLFQVTGGRMAVGNVANGISIATGVTATSNPGPGQLLMTGGTTTTPKITFGASGSTLATQGYLTLNGAAASLFVGSGGIVKAATSTYTETISLTAGTLGASADWASSLNMNLNGSGTAVRIRAADESGIAANITLSGAISGTGGFAKEGGGMLTLTGSNSYTGPTAVSAGKLVANGVLGSGSLSVAATAWLMGSGTVLGPVTMSGTLSPGNSPGLLTLKSLDLQSTSTTVMEVNGTSQGVTYDSILVTDASGLAYGGGLQLSFGSTFPDNTTFDLFGFTGTPAGTFTSVTADGSYGALTFTKVAGVWTAQSGGQTISYTESTGDVLVVPEPSALGLLGCGLTAAVIVRRRAVGRRHGARGGEFEHCHLDPRA